MKLGKDFYTKRATELAPLLLGKLLCRNIDGKIIKKRITETEIYFGENDSACHASRGKTERTKILYEEGGIAYVYLCYGIHHLFNVVTGLKDFPEAVLIRGIEGYQGPGKLTKFLNIDRALNGEDLVNSDKLWIEDDGYVAKYITTPRIGIDYASEEDRKRLWRFVLTEGELK
ncbi:MAG: DNA-3-methyladenine glycosylase [Clostridiaceae bacterium]|nr:DNA-3-methyladenine glycosylase [Clostridiaceae bacterium]